MNVKKHPQAEALGQPMPRAPRMCGPGGTNLLCVSYLAGPLITGAESRSNARYSRSPLEHSAGRRDRGLYRPVHPPRRGRRRIVSGPPQIQALGAEEVSGTFLRGTSERGPIPSRSAWTWTWPPYQGCHGQRTSRELVLWVFGCATVHGGPPHNGLDGRTAGMVYCGAPPPWRVARDVPSRIPLVPPGSLSRAVGPPRTCCGELERRR